MANVSGSKKTSMIFSAVAHAGVGSAPRDQLSREQYVARRVRNQIDGFYLPKADANMKIAASLRWIEFGLALAAHCNGWYRWKGDLWHQIRFRCSHGRAHYDCSCGACAH